MASQQLAKEYHPPKVQPRDFTYTSGNWRIPTHDNPSAEVVHATRIEATAKFDINPLKRNIVTLIFQFLKQINKFGWDAAGLSIGAKVGENGNYVYHNINKLFVDMEPNVKKFISVTFDLEENTDASDGKLHFGIFDLTKEDKGGLVFYGVDILKADEEK